MSFREIKILSVVAIVLIIGLELVTALTEADYVVWDSFGSISSVYFIIGGFHMLIDKEKTNDADGSTLFLWVFRYF